jgi:DNA-binding response OmpR family regulator
MRENEFDIIDRLSRIHECSVQDLSVLARDAATEIANLRSILAGSEPPVAGAWIDWNRREIIDGFARHPLDRQEWAVFEALARNAGQIVSHEQLQAVLYADGADEGLLDAEGVIAERVCSLRRKSPWRLHTVTGVGYMLENMAPPPRRMLDRHHGLGAALNGEVALRAG